jgi:hypothetical protein
MRKSTSRKEFKIETPATYRIRVQGHIDSEWSELIGDMSITTDLTTDRSPVTILVGYMADQASLSGLLKALYDRRIPLLSVENLDEKTEKDRQNNWLSVKKVITQ